MPNQSRNGLESQDNQNRMKIFLSEKSGKHLFQHKKTRRATSSRKRPEEDASDSSDDNGRPPSSAAQSRSSDSDKAKMKKQIEELQAQLLAAKQSGSPSDKKRRKSAAKASSAKSPAPRELRAGDDLLLMIKGKQHGGIVHAIQPEIVPETIPRIVIPWWNSYSPLVAYSILRNGVKTFS